MLTSWHRRHKRYLCPCRAQSVVIELVILVHDDMQSTTPAEEQPGCWVVEGKRELGEGWGLVITLCTVAVNRTFVLKVHTTGQKLSETVAL